MATLKFNEPLSWRAGKAIPVADLLSRLQKLARELKGLPQEETDRQILKGVSQDLANGHLLGHRDKGVRAWTACCLVEIFRLCAPDAPFTQAQLKEIFTLFITSIIPALADPSNAYNSQHVYVLNSLAEVKSIILLTDLAQPDSLLLALFSSAFDVVSGSAKSSSGEEIAPHVKSDVTALLVTVIDEAQALPSDVVDVIIAQFLRVDPRAVSSDISKNKKNGEVADEKQGTLLPREYSPGYNVSKAICDSCTDKMAQYISQYFSEVIMDASDRSAVNGGGKHKPHRRASFDDSDEEVLNAPSGEDMKELSKAHKLVRELWRACPDVLQNVIPQLEVELSTESVSLRTLATETLGDVASGIGIAGPPPSQPMDPAAYPPATLTASHFPTAQLSVFQTPISQKPFSQTHNPVYETFLGRRQDKSAAVRAAWTTAIGRILITSGGGIGLSEAEEKRLMTGLTQMLGDADEQVRSRAVNAVSQFSFSDVVLRLGANGGVSTAESTLSVLCERVKDRKHSVREEAMKFLGRLWGVASGELEENNEQVIAVLGDAPAKIFDAYLTNDPDIIALIDHVLWELLLPLGYPPGKSKGTKAANGSSQAVKDTQTDDSERIDTDRVRVRRILTLIRRLDEKSRKLFYAIQSRQVNFAKYVEAYLEQCELYNGGVTEGDSRLVEARLAKLIEVIAKGFPTSLQAVSDLKAFAKKHDRRNYQLIRFCMDANCDYQTVQKAIKEFTKRIQSSSPNLLNTLTLLLYRSSFLVYNKSHVPTIMDFSRSDDPETASAAHELLTEISSRAPEVLKAHVHAICKDLEQEAPSAKKPEGAGVEETLKACAGFAKKFPAEIPKDRKFLVAMNNFALYSNSPRAAKHAVSILIAVADKKEMYAKDLIQKCTKDWKYGSNHFLARLATLAQLNLLAPEQADDESDEIISIAVNQILLNNRSSSPAAGYEWSEVVDEETIAKEFALKMIVNRIRSWDNPVTLRETAAPAFSILNTLIANQGELSKKGDSPAAQKPRLRLLAANLILKLCSTRRTLDELFSNGHFNSIALVAQDPIFEVRSGFISKLKEYLSQPKLGTRWYTIVFILAYEPTTTLKDSTLTWIRGRSSIISRQSKGQQTAIIEGVFARLLSLLAHHPDYSNQTPEDLVDFAQYFLFYLSAVATESNLSLIFHIAQRVKQTQDAIIQDPEAAEVINNKLYHLSDLAQATIRRFEDFRDWPQMQTWPGKVKLPSSLFAPLPSHDVAQEIADKNYLPEEAEELLDKVVRLTLRPKSSSHSMKRKAESIRAGVPAVKKQKKAKMEKALSIRKSSKTPKKRTALDETPSSERRRSGRAAGGKSYKEDDSDEEDAEMEEWNQAEEDDAEDTQPGKEASSEVEEAEEPEQDEVVQRNGKVSKKVVAKGNNKATSSPSSPKTRPTATKGRRTRAAAAAGSDGMEE